MQLGVRFLWLDSLADTKVTIFRCFYYLSRIKRKEKSPWWKKTRETEWPGKFITVPDDK
jgi:hypothetical protein